MDGLRYPVPLIGLLIGALVLPVWLLSKQISPSWLGRTVGISATVVITLVVLSRSRTIELE